jgi:7-cyano-7-deazaguanine synthase
MDSCVCAALATRDYATAALHVSYGQRTEHRERQSFLEICDRLQIHDKLLVRNEALRAIGGSALTDENIAVPTVPSAGREIPVTYVPFATRISYRSRSAGPRCSEPRKSISARSNRTVPAILIAVRRIMKRSTGSFGREPKRATSKLSRPLIAMRKAEIVRLALN